jgi:hypothetical protein
MGRYEEAAVEGELKSWQEFDLIRGINTGGTYTSDHDQHKSLFSLFSFFYLDDRWIYDVVQLRSTSRKLNM